MSSKEEQNSFQEVPASQSFLRQVALKLTAPYFKKELVDSAGHGFDRLDQLAAKGYGFIFLLNHFSKGDVPRAIATVFEIPSLSKRRVLTPVAIHQYKRWQDLLGRNMGITSCPIPTPDTTEYVRAHPQSGGKFAYALSRKGGSVYLDRYLQQAVTILDTGGINIVFPQGGRRPSIDMDNATNAVGTLISRANRAKIERFAIVFMGIGIEGLKDYGDPAIANNLNSNLTYQFRLGEILTIEEYARETNKSGLDNDSLALQKLQSISY